MRESEHTRKGWEATLKEPEECSILGDSWDSIKRIPNVFLLGKIQTQGEWVIWKHLKRFLVHFSFKYLIIGFDQEAVVIVMACQVPFTMETKAEFDPIRWLDNALINLSSPSGNFQNETPTSFSLPQRLSIFPQTLFHFQHLTG